MLQKGSQGEREEEEEEEEKEEEEEEEEGCISTIFLLQPATNLTRLLSSARRRACRLPPARRAPTPRRWRRADGRGCRASRAR